MELSEYSDVLESINFIAKAEKKEADRLDLKRQMNMAENDPALRKA
jgi:hypothetical protein